MRGYSGIEGFRRKQLLYVAGIMFSGLIGGMIAYMYTPGDIKAYATTTITLSSIILAAAYWAFSASPKLKAAKSLSSVCGEVLFLPRRHSFICSKMGVIYCYNYAVSRFYAIMIDRRVDRRRIKSWTPLDYYCVKFLGGRLEREGVVDKYAGRFEALSPKPNMILIGEGIVLFSGELENLVGKVNSLEGSV